MPDQTAPIEKSAVLEIVRKMTDELHTAGVSIMVDSWTDCKMEQIFGITAQTDNGVVGLENTTALLRHRYAEIRSSCMIVYILVRSQASSVVRGGFPTGVKWALDGSSMGFGRLSPSAMWT